MAVGTVALATASDSERRAPKVPRADGDGAAGIARVYSALKAQNPFAVFVADHDEISTPPPSTRTRTRPRTRVFAAAVDWPFTYSFVAKSVSFSEEDVFSDSAFGGSLVRRNAVSGERRVLMRVRRSLPVSLRAGGGRAYLGLISGGTSNGAISRILAFDHTADKPITISSDRTTASDNTGGDACGRNSSLNGVGPAGEALILRLTVTCATDGARTTDAELVSIARDGSETMLDPNPNTGGMTFGSADLLGTTLVQSGGFAGTITSLDTVSKVKTRLWDTSGGRDATLAADGSVVLSPFEGNDLSSLFYWDDSYSNRRQAKPVLFPQSDAEAPAVIADAGYKTVTMRYCGQQLYELRLPRSARSDFTAQVFALYDGLPIESKLNVYARDLTGGSPRLVTTTDKVWVRALGCDGESLVLATDRRTATGALRVGP